MKVHMTSIKNRLKNNWRSGITVALVSIPLSVSLAVASGTTPVAGIVTAIWAGLMTSLLGGSNYNIVGPTGALSGVLATYAIIHGADTLPMLAITSGILIFLSWLLKFERFIALIPASTVHGFTIGVAGIIALNQFNFATGLRNLPKHPKFIQNVFESFSNINHASIVAVICFAVFLALLFIIIRYFKKIPPVIVLTPFGIALGYLSAKGMLPFHIDTLGDIYPTLHPVLFIPHSFSLTSDTLVASITIALIAILETMISAKIADVMTKTKYEKRKELFGLSVANIVSGLFGGIPATAALARTSLNVKSGANDKMSATVSAIFVAIISFALLTSFVYIPLAVIAAILVFVALRMIEHEHLVTMWKLDRKSFWLAIVVAGVTLYEDPIIGILVGATIALLMLIEKISRGHFELVTNNQDDPMCSRIMSDKLSEKTEPSHTIVYSIKGQLMYINGESHINRFEKELLGHENVILRLRELYLLDLEGVAAFDEIVTAIKAQGQQVYISSINPSILSLLRESKLFLLLEKEGKVYERTHDALRALGYK